MGCRNTKAKEPAPEKENVDFNAVSANGTENLDPRLPLDARQVFKLKQSWKGIKRKIEETGVEMFVRLFKNNSYLKTIFQDFKQLETEDEMRENEALEHHATLVMTTLDEAISNMHNYDYVKDHLHRTGGTHQRFIDFRLDNFHKIKEPFLEAVKITLDDRYTEYMANVYSLTIDFILTSLRDGFTDNNQANVSPQQKHGTPQIIVSSHPVEADYIQTVQRNSVDNGGEKPSDKYTESSNDDGPKRS